jgi:L-ribulose-5-phosphate 3-epimerase
MSPRFARRVFLQGALIIAGAAWAQCARAEDPPAKPQAPPKRPKLKKAIKYDMIAGDATPLEKLTMCKELGFEGVEIDSPSKLDLDQLIAARDATGVLIHGVVDSVHWETRLSDPDEDVRKRALAALRTAIHDAHKVGADTVLLVPGAVRDPEHENFEQVWSRSQDEIRKVLPLAREQGVKLAIEVVWNGFITKPDDLVKYIDGFEDPTVGAYFDCSNMIKFGTPNSEWIKKLGARLLKLDFKGYNKTEGWVAIGEGDEDWPSVLDALASIGYTGWATAEVSAGGREHLEKVSKRMSQVLELP